MAIYEREREYIRLLSHGQQSVKDLAGALFISEPTVRRDILQMKKKGLVDSRSGIVWLSSTSPDQRIPMYIRDVENVEAKNVIAEKAASYIRNGNVLMLDASTTAYCLLPHLSRFKNLFVITSGAKTAIDLAILGIKTICLGGEMAIESFSYIGPDAEATLRNYHADIAFFSCRGYHEGTGVASDNTIMENSIRRIMIENSKKSYLLCDSSKFGYYYLNILCKADEIDGVISENS